jgi:hypothetical protein
MDISLLFSEVIQEAAKKNRLLGRVFSYCKTNAIPPFF